ncbi:MAG: DNA cytosine methyltransferase [Rickettsiales bacterium]
MKSNALTFIDLFAGIGGFHLAWHNLGAKCVFASEIDPFARLTYEENFRRLSPQLFENGLFNPDITAITFPSEEIPNFDILCAGFPCQPFSQAGFKRGFAEEKDKRGNMFFIIAEIIEAKRPSVIFLENVRHLLNHDGGKTFETIRAILSERLGYNIYWQVVKASDYGLPQHRPRLFIVGFRKEDNYGAEFKFPRKLPLNITMNQVWGDVCEKEIGYTLRVGGRSSGVGDRRNWDCYIVGGQERRMGPKEGRRMMGFPDDFVFPVSKTQAMKQLGNSVAVHAVQAVGETIIERLQTLRRQAAKPVWTDKAQNAAQAACYE